VSRLTRYDRILVEIVVSERWGLGIRPPTTVGVRKKNPSAMTWRCSRGPTFNRFDTIPACDRQTDGQTDTRSRQRSVQEKLTASAWSENVYISLPYIMAARAADIDRTEEITSLSYYVMNCDGA